MGRGVALKQASGDAVAIFIQDNIICRFGIPLHILSDNGTLLLNLTCDNFVRNMWLITSSIAPYHPQGNG